MPKSSQDKLDDLPDYKKSTQGNVGNVPWMNRSYTHTLYDRRPAEALAVWIQRDNDPNRIKSPNVSQKNLVDKALA